MIITTISNKVNKTEPLGEGHLCPYCKNENQLVVTWVQPQISNLGFQMLLKKNVPLINCDYCGKWIKYKSLSTHTKEVLEMQKKAIPVSFKLKPTVFFLLLTTFLAGIFIYFKVIEPYFKQAETANIRQGTKLWVSDFDIRTANKTSTWYLVSRINGDTVVLKRHKIISDKDLPNDLPTTEDQFLASEYKVSLKYLQSERRLVGLVPEILDASGRIESIQP